jgi:hypothetical protein
VFAACWSVKGGSGTTVFAAALGLVLARRHDEGALLVDLCGDLPAVLGLPEPSGPGLAGWFAAGAGVPADGLARLEVPVGVGVSLLPRGEGPLQPADRAGALLGSLGQDPRSVVIDCGVPRWYAPADAPEGVPGRVVTGVPESLLVTRSCYLALRRLVAAPVRPTGVVLVTEAGRALGRRDVEQVIGVDVVAEIPVDPAVARAVDAGLLAGRLPASLIRALRSA